MFAAREAGRALAPQDTTGRGPSPQGVSRCEVKLLDGLGGVSLANWRSGRIPETLVRCLSETHNVAIDSRRLSIGSDRGGGGAVSCEPFLAEHEVRHHAFESAPELRIVLSLLEVHQFVSNHVLRHARRKQDGLPVEVEPRTPTAGTPSI